MSNNVQNCPNPSPNSGRCIYGFVLFLVSILMVLLYFLYAIIPSKMFVWIGFTYFERKYWSLAFPTQILVSILSFALFLYPSVNYLFTPSLNASNTLFDSNSLHSKTINKNKAIPPIRDLKPDFVSQQLFLTDD